ncbi:MAG: hypothetical protein MUF34_19045 [Polyangiaceae bacterium]|nr:hypothetical protein [Polyangiaceae bacterium]
MALGPDGTILASGGRGAGALRLLADGALDLSFGDSGFSALGPADLVSRAIARQADGKAVVAGFQTELDSLGGLSFVRLNVDGALDPSFGAGGVLTIEVPGGAGIFDLAVQDDGKIVAAGEGQPRFSADCPMVARLTPSGALDPSFAGGGLTFYQAPSPGPDVLFGRARAVFLSPDSSLWAVGDGVSLENQGGFQTIDLLLLRYRPDGTLDPTSGVNGATYIDYAAPPVEGAPNDRDNFALSVARGDDGRLVTGGEVYDLFNPTTNRGVVTRHLADGRLDPSFGESGVFVIPELSRIFGVTVLADDSVMAIGFRLNNEGTAFVDFALHLLADGTPDAAFGVDGQLDLGAGFFADSVERQADGKVLIGGSRAIEGGGSHPFFMRLQR